MQNGGRTRGTETLSFCTQWSRLLDLTTSRTLLESVFPLQLCMALDQPPVPVSAKSGAYTEPQQSPVEKHVQMLPAAGDPAKDIDNQPAWQGYNSVFTAAKAGMQNVDKQKVKRIVYEMSKDSAHFRNEQRKQAQVDMKIAQLKARATALSPSELAAHQKACDAKITQLEATRDLTKTWLHVDMDAFYASVEELGQPALKTKPMAVGGMGMICTANYEARKFGVRSAMPGFIARKLCPQLVFVKPDFEKYTAASEQTRAVFRLYDPAFEAGSLDEAYLDITSYCREHAMTGVQVAAELRAKVTAATQLTCSVGVAPNITLAKIASDMNKPDGQAVVDANRDAVMAFIYNLQIRKIPGIGKVSEQTLNALGINTCSEVISQRALVAALLSPISCNFLLTAGLGLGATEHGSRTAGQDSSLPRRKGISCERTFSAISSPAAMEQMAGKLVQHLASDMAAEGIAAKTLTLKLKTTAFQVRTRAVTLPQYVSTAEQMLQPILRLLKAELPVEIRLMGVRGSNLRKVHKPGDTLAAAGQKLNVLQRLILQGQQQHQAGQQRHEEAQMNGSRQMGSSEEVPQQQWAAGGMHFAVDLLDEDHCGSEVAAAGDGYDSDDVSNTSIGASKAAAGHHQPQQQEQQQQHGGLGHHWQQWQQLMGPEDNVTAGMQLLHQQLQEHIQQSKQPGSPANKRARIEVPSATQQLQHSGGSALHEQTVTAGQLCKEPELILPLQQQLQQQGYRRPAGCRPSSQQQLDMPQQQQQDNHHHGSPHGRFQQAVASTPGDIAAAAVDQLEGHTLAHGEGVGTGGPQSHLVKHAGVSKCKSVWTCLACTYSSNKPVMLRCEVCDTPKGDTSAPPKGWLCTRSSRGNDSKAGSKVITKAGGRDKQRQGGATSSRASNKQQAGQSGIKQMSLKDLVQ